MNKKIKYFVFFLIFILLYSCSFDRVTGFWSGSEEEKLRIAEIEKQQRDRISSETIYSTDNIYLEEIAPVKTSTLSSPKTVNSWTMSGLNYQNSPGNIYLSSIDNNFLKKKIGKNKFSLSKIMSSPLTFDQNIILTDDTGNIFNITKRGKINWKKNIYIKAFKKIYKNLTFSIYKNNLYVADNIGFIYAINLKSGKLVWIKNHGVPLRSNIKIIDNKLFVINQDNRILCLDTEDGSKIWDVRTISSFIKSQNFLALAISKKKDIFMLNSSGDLLKIQSKNGKIYWSLNIVDSEFSESTDFFSSSDIVIKENDIVLSTSNSIFSFNISNGYLNWQQNVGSKNTPIIDGKNIFLVTDNGYFLNIDRLSGKIIWSVNILKILKKKKRATKITGFILGSGKIYATTLNGFIIICSATSGKIEKFKKIGDQIISSPIISDSSLYILTEESRILGFN